LSELGDFGGPTLVHAPLPGSPAIDTGTSLAAPLTDQRGIARPLDGDGDGVAIYDIGAVEILNPHYLVTLVVPTQLGLRLDGMALELVDLPAQQIIIKEPFNSAGSMHIDGSQGADSLIVLGDGLGGWPISFAGRGGDDLLSVQLASAPPAQTAANPLPLLVRFEGGEGTGDRFRLRGNDRAEDIQLIAKQGQAAQPHFDIVARDVASGLPTLRMAAAQTEAFAVHAGGGADFVALNLSGAWSGAVLAFDLDTGDGNDRLRVAIDAVLAGLKVRADGGAGDDDLEMAVAADGAQELFLLLDGGSGFDVGRATANVLVKNIEQFTPIGK
jgi:hypothetical protein